MICPLIGRGIRTFDFSRKTTNAVLSDLQIVDVVKWFFKKIANSQHKGPQQFVDFLGLNFGTTAAWNSATRFFVKFCFNRQI